MTMRRLLFELALAAAIVVLSTLTAKAEEATRIDSIPEGMTAYDVRLERYIERHAKIAPHYTKIQFAGSIGMLSVAAGWDYGKNERWETDIMVGFVPRFDSNRAKLTFTLRENLVPWSIPIGKSPVDFSPMRAYLGVNAIMGHEFWKHNPDRYPDGYYFFSTKFHIIAGFGQQWTLNISRDKRKMWRAVGVFYDFSTNDSYVLSGFDNKYIKFRDVFHLDIGVKLQIL